MPRAKTTNPDCLTCGACCVAPKAQRGFADLQPVDEKRMGVRLCNKYVVRATAFDMLAAAFDGRSIPVGVIRVGLRMLQGGPLRGWELPVCAALQGSPMHGVKCAIYEKRPNVCRNAVVPGDKVCTELRKAFNKCIAKEAREEAAKDEKGPKQRRRRVRS